jgi:hypothetical protein
MVVCRSFKAVKQLRRLATAFTGMGLSLFVQRILKIFGMRADGSVKFTTRHGKRTGVLCHSQKRRSSS